MKMTKLFQYIVVFILAIQFISCNKTGEILITNKTASPTVEFAVKELKQTFENSKVAATVSVTIEIDEKLEEQAFSIKKTDGNRILVSGGDPAGVMYGVLELTEQISLSTDLNTLKEVHKEPFIKKRGIKINIPLDARLPSYDDTGDAAQNNIAEMWNMDFWHEYLDNLARNRYNVLSLWTKHPFPGLIKMKDFPEVALDDVYAFAGERTPETHKDWRGIDLFAPENLKLIKKISIDEKIKFWQEVMQYAHDRGIEIYLFTWNAYVTGAEKYGIKPLEESAIPYMKECVKQFALTYPHLAGMGVTAGENLPMTIGERTNVEWLRDTYGEGIKAAIEENPERKIRFIFRRHHTNLPQINREFKPFFPGKVETSFKYSFAHLYSTTTPPRYDNEYAKYVEEYDYKCWMNLRNDDNFTFRWGDPDYVRDYFKKMASYPIAGFYMGSDGYVWGRESISKNSELSGELEVTKHWYREMLWGRLAFDPSLGKTFFVNTLKNKYPEVDAETLYSTWQLASKVLPTVTNFHWKGGDSMWSIEGCFDIEYFHSVREFINGFSFEPKKIMNIPDYVTAILTHKKDDRVTPIQVAEELFSLSEKSFKQLTILKQDQSKYPEALKETIADIEALAWLGKYYGYKILGATNLHLYESATDKANYKSLALDNLKEGVKCWEKYAENAASRYKVQLLARTRHLDWKGLIPEVKKDIQIVEASTGEIPKIAKVFYRQALRKYPELKKNLKKTLVNAGYEYHELRAWELHGHATGYRICIMKEGDLSHEEFLDAGGVIPDSYAKKGIAVIKYHGVTWILGKNEQFASKALAAYLNEF